MLIITRRPTEETKIGGDASGQHTLFDAQGNPVEITITILGVKAHSVRIGLTAPRDIPVHRAEIERRVRRENHGEASGNVAPGGVVA